MNQQELRRFCLAFPGATEDIKWGADLCFCVAKKMFAVTGLEGGGISLKVEPPLFQALIGSRGIIPAPYVARYHWISIEDPSALPRAELEELLRGSYELVVAALPAKSRRELGADATGGATRDTSGAAEKTARRPARTSKTKAAARSGAKGRADSAGARPPQRKKTSRPSTRTRR